VTAILGISAFDHHSAAALVVEGRVGEREGVLRPEQAEGLARRALCLCRARAAGEAEEALVRRVPDLIRGDFEERTKPRVLHRLRAEMGAPPGQSSPPGARQRRPLGLR
jgi:hypothetical protein